MSRVFDSHALSFSVSNSPLLSSSNAFVGDLETIGNLLPVVEDGVGDGGLKEKERRRGRGRRFSISLETESTTSWKMKTTHSVKSEESSVEN